MRSFETFTKQQQETYTRVHDLEEQLMESVDPTTFVLNPETLALRKKIDEVQNTCDHIWEDGICIVCGKEESNK